MLLFTLQTSKDIIAAAEIVVWQLGECFGQTTVPDAAEDDFARLPREAGLLQVPVRHGKLVAKPYLEAPPTEGKLLPSMIRSA